MDSKNVCINKIGFNNFMLRILQNLFNPQIVTAGNVALSAVLTFTLVVTG